MSGRALHIPLVTRRFLSCGHHQLPESSDSDGPQADLEFPPGAALDGVSPTMRPITNQNPHRRLVIALSLTGEGGRRDIDKPALHQWLQSRRLET